MALPRVLLLLMLCIISCGRHAFMDAQDSAITNYLDERATWQPMCLYTFDDPAISNGVAIRNQVPDDACPFDALQPDNALVTTLNTESSFYQLGVHLANPSNSTHTQLSSISSVSARDFFTMAAVRNKTSREAGVTFEMVIRRYSDINQSMTLFSIANEYDNCVDPGFRLDVNEHQVLTFIYFLPVREENGQVGVEACYEQRLFSVDSSAACLLPPLSEPIEQTPPVHITVTLDPSSTRGLWKTDFYMSYTNVTTMDRVNCVVHDEQHPPNTQLLDNRIQGRYRLYLGNSPRNVTFPARRKQLAPTRILQPLGNTRNLNATERLRSMIKQQLTRISGPRLPTAMRIFGDSSASLNFMGITFPSLNEDTPLAYLRSKISSFKEQYGDQIVDYLVNSIQQNARNPLVGQQTSTSTNHSSNGSETFSRANLYQGADSASFDLFHFAIYRRVVTEEAIASISRQQLLPSRNFPSLVETVRIPEDSLVLLNITMLHGVFNDLRLEVRRLPEFGQLLLFPSKTALTTTNLDTFRELPLEFQRRVFFQPRSDQNNQNLPLPNPVAFSRRLEPYATVSFGIAESVANRLVNKSVEAKINIFVDAVNDAPRPRASELTIHVQIGVPVSFDLKGDDGDGSPPVASLQSKDTNSSDVLLSHITFTEESIDTTSHQLLRIVQLPRFGKLFDCNARCETVLNNSSHDLSLLESFRIYRNSTTIVNATHSTNLTYVYHGWSQDELIAPIEVDELRYTLSDGDLSVSSNVGVVNLILEDEERTRQRDNVIGVIQLEEDLFQLLDLRLLDPLAATLSADIRMNITTLPQHGALFQYKEAETSKALGSSLACIGEIFTVFNTTVSDMFGRVFYVPQLDYFNVEPRSLVGQIFDADYFEYHISSATPLTNNSLFVYENSPTACFSNGLEPRRVELQVANVPDALTVSPPFDFTTNLSSSSAIPTPVVFDDPDSLSLDDTYQVNLETEDDTSVLELGFPITDDNVMSECSFERPCTLFRSTNGSALNVSTKAPPSDKLQFHIETQLYDPSHIEVTGTRTALGSALSALTFRSVFLGKSHIKQFTLWVKRVNDSDDAHQAQGTFTVTFSEINVSGSTGSESLVSVFNSQLERYVSTLLVVLAGWLVLSNASCFSLGFCCCCCKARKKWQQKVELQQRRFQAQVAQNDYEYSTLLMSLANVLLEPNLLVSRCVLETCRSLKSSKKGTERLVQAFILRNLLPLLESERQGTRLVFQLIALEHSESMRGSLGMFQCHDFMMEGSLASKALVYFCRLIGSTWIATLLNLLDDASLLKETVSKVGLFLDNLAAQIDALPAEIVILCRGCAQLIQRNRCNPSHSKEQDAVQLVFFNHFLGPALLFPRCYVNGLATSTDQQSTMRVIAFWIVDCTDSGDHTKAEDLRSQRTSIDTLRRSSSLEVQSAATCRYRYEAVLERILHSTTLSSVYNPNEAKTNVDCELMGMCLINMHSFFDSYYSEFKQQMLLASISTNVEEIEGTITRVRRLLKALDWPLASISDLVEYARPELLNDSVLWNGFSFREWKARIALTASHRPVSNGSERTASILAHAYFDHEEVILDDIDGCPRNVDWL